MSVRGHGGSKLRAHRPREQDNVRVLLRKSLDVQNNGLSVHVAVLLMRGRGSTGIALNNGVIAAPTALVATMSSRTAKAELLPSPRGAVDGAALVIRS